MGSVTVYQTPTIYQQGSASTTGAFSPAINIQVAVIVAPQIVIGL